VLDIGSIGVSVVLSVIIVIIATIIVSKKVIAPIIIALIEEKTQEAQNLMKAAGSAMGRKSGETRQLAKMEKMVIEDLLAEYPEIELALDRFSPETSDYIRDNPRAAMHLYRRWKPFLDEFLGSREQEKSKFDL